MTNIGACHLLCGIAASTFASTNVDAGDVCVSTLNETFDPATATAGTTYGEATYVDVDGNTRLKLVADGFDGTWGTWVSPPIPEQVVEFRVSFRFSLKNLGGGPGDGFSFLWGDLSDTIGTRMSGGEWGVEAFATDGGGLSVGFQTYPDLGNDGVAGRWGGETFVFAPFTYDLVRYDEYEVAVDPTKMATATITWTADAGTTVTIALPTFPPQEIFLDEGEAQTGSVDPRDWSFGIAARNGAIDQDVLIGDLDIEVTTVCEPVFDPSDLNQDGAIDGADLGILLSGFGPCPDSPCLGDIDGNEIVDGGDLGVLLSAWTVTKPRLPRR